jgi:putative transposase
MLHPRIDPSVNDKGFAVNAQLAGDVNSNQLGRPAENPMHFAPLTIMHAAPVIPWPGVGWEITQHARPGCDLFHDDDDRWLYLRLLTRSSDVNSFDILAFSLLPECIAVVVLARPDIDVLGALRRINAIFAQQHQKRHGTSPPLWNPRLAAALHVDHEIVDAIARVETAPVAAGLVARAWDYTWSSARAHTGRDFPLIPLGLTWWRTHVAAGEWAARLDSSTAKVRAAAN